ncbi:MAG: 3-hydroxyacyl-CoA dehydrogenase [candidate division WOR-3 bacterium]|nr:3-hydroxyacyl-CoA dehydrogenase [candidate division WOR-3 bacterium]MCX7948023.1 3-hydroxyacyl-CoA dehydrogenase [candidate division WOR-3 bacterium]MDW8151079.1 3-hydroxyacyl-CoA dehydrogenase NAD-binding domain-containing protein [candidate division WOR-3 bacterium]
MKVAVIGCGTMGKGIAYLFLKYGNFVQIYDENKLSVENAIKYFDSYIKEEYMSRLKILENLEEIDKDSDILIEAIVEDLEKKKLLFKTIETMVNKQTIIATNTSSLSINELSESLENKERFLGMHFFNPPAVMKLVEIIKSDWTKEEYLNRVVEIAKNISKEVVICKDSPGFIVNRIARPFYLQALRLYESGISYELIDKIIKVIGFKMGPFELMDLIGIDINYSVSKIIYEKTKLERLKPSKIQEEMIKNGLLGMKVGKGFYKYPRESEKLEFKYRLNLYGTYQMKNFKFFTIGYGAEVFSYEDENIIKELRKLDFEHFVLHNLGFSISEKIINAIKLEANEVYKSNIATKEDINKAMRLGANYPIDVID